MSRPIAVFVVLLLLVLAGGVSVAQSPTPDVPGAAAILGFSEGQTIDVGPQASEAAEDSGIRTPFGLLLMVVIGLPFGVALFRHRRGDESDDRVAARAREKAMLREVEGAPIFGYLAAVVWARWLGLTGSDRRVVYLLWLTLSVAFISLTVLQASSKGLTSETLIGLPALSLVVIGLWTVALIFRMPR